MNFSCAADFFTCPQRWKGCCFFLARSFRILQTLFHSLWNKVLYNLLNFPGNEVILFVKKNVKSWWQDSESFPTITLVLLQHPKNYVNFDPLFSFDVATHTCCKLTPGFWKVGYMTKLWRFWSTDPECGFESRLTLVSLSKILLSLSLCPSNGTWNQRSSNLGLVCGHQCGSARL